MTVSAPPEALTPVGPPPVLPYPSNDWLRAAAKSPILFYRLGLGGFIGRLFMVLTTTGRKSGLPRRTAIEFHAYRGRKYVYSAWGTRADWFRNIEADPVVTIQTADGAEACIARRLADEDELAEAFDFAVQNPTLRAWFDLLGIELTLESFLARCDELCFVTFDPTDVPAPPPVTADLKWVWPVLGALGLIWLLACRLRRRTN
ncbi:MAG: nitroreductase family deazaflavin-dependent oxidoreductase [Anaerolineae bacterium]|nr:nitroreductase family deazaflavin-dependent oxidoreductase [Anaerolineae bacterium]